MRPKIRNQRNYTQVSEDLDDELRGAPLHKQLNVHEICFNRNPNEFDHNHRPNNNYFLLNDRRVRINRPNRVYLNKRMLPSKLPFLIGQEQPDDLSVFQQIPMKFDNAKKKNVSLLNAMIDILKPEDAGKDRDERSDKHFQDRKMSEFAEGTQSASKNHRRPRIVENEMMKLPDSSIARRRIVSEEKSRRNNYRESRELRKEGLEGIEILTFCNKFPGLRKLDSRGDGHLNENEFID